jgi:cob(I)alamin adenosyltransferase
MTEPKSDDEHHEKMARFKAARVRMMETKTESRGLVIVHTG